MIRRKCYIELSFLNTNTRNKGETNVKMFEVEALIADCKSNFEGGIFPDGFGLGNKIVYGDLNLKGAVIIGDLELHETTVYGNVELSDATIDGDLTLWDASIAECLDLSRTKIKGKIHLVTASGPKAIYVDQSMAQLIHWAAPTTPLMVQREE